MRAAGGRIQTYQIIRSTTIGFAGVSSVTNSGEFDGFRKVNVESQSSLAGITLKLVDRIPMNIPQEIYKMETKHMIFSRIKQIFQLGSLGRNGFHVSVHR